MLAAGRRPACPGPLGRATGRVVRLTPRTRARLHGIARWAVAILIGLTGAWLGLIVAGRTEARLGPFDVRLAGHFGPGVTRIVLPPFGRLTANTHTGPITFSA